MRCGSNCWSGNEFIELYWARSFSLLAFSHEFMILFFIFHFALFVGAFIFVKIKVPHPSFPSTHISIQVPNLGIHFSPSRYHRLMDLLNICDGVEDTEKPTTDGFETMLSPWIPADLANDAKILVWKVNCNIGEERCNWWFFAMPKYSQCSQTDTKGTIYLIID